MREHRRHVAKVADVGAGWGGQACAFALMLRGSAREIVLIDRIAEPARTPVRRTDLPRERLPRHGAEPLKVQTGQAAALRDMQEP